jgi:hypothetical protein
LILPSIKSNILGEKLWTFYELPAQVSLPQPSLAPLPLVATHKNGICQWRMQQQTFILNMA